MTGSRRASLVGGSLAVSKSRNSHKAERPQKSTKGTKEIRRGTEETEFENSVFGFPFVPFVPFCGHSVLAFHVLQQLVGDLQNRFVFGLVVLNEFLTQVIAHG